MLADLRIENLAIVEHVRARFSSGLNVLSGETGAGKSILLQALGLALGGRASSALVRAGCKQAVVEARFLLTGPAGGSLAERLGHRLEERGLPAAGDELLVRRLVTGDGRSRAYVNDASVTVGALAEIVEGMVELTGQHDQFGLLRSDRQLDLLDEYAQLGGLGAAVAERVARFRAAERRWRELREALARRAERHEFLAFYLREFEQLDPRPGEDAELMDEARRLSNAERLRRGVTSALEAIYEGRPSATDLLGEARDQLAALLAADSQLSGHVGTLDELLSRLDDLARALQRYADADLDDPERLETIQARLHAIQRVCRKHGTDLDGLIEKMAAARAELDQLSDLEHLIEVAQQDLDAARARAMERASSLSDRRAEAIPRLVCDTEDHLGDLGFTQSRLLIDQDRSDDPADLTERGLDQVQFLLSANPGHPPRPLAKVASGGELSRILLGLKSALASVDRVPVQVFDEIDTGIGGAAAEIVGRKIRQLADGAQVLCVTHLPQIASFADRHLVVTKEVLEAMTRTTLRQLDAAEREEEVARMLGGMEITEATREHAREMLGRAQAAV